MEIEHALAKRRIDLAVHSLKDLPTAQPQGLRIVAAGSREDVRDVLVWHDRNTQPTSPLRIGTCSLRRTAQIRALFPDAQILPLRGNVDTRLRKLDAGEYDAIVLAAAGLHRLDLPSRLAGRVSYFPVETLMPAPGQGALAVEIRDELDMREPIQPMVNRDAQAATSTERSFMRRLGAVVYLPVAAHGEIVAETMTRSAPVTSLN